MSDHEPVAELDLSALEEVKPHELAIRFAFGAIPWYVVPTHCDPDDLPFPAITPATCVPCPN